MLTIHDMGHEPTERNGQDDEHGKVQDVLNRSVHSLRITPHQNVDVIDKESNADDSDDGNEDVHYRPFHARSDVSDACSRKRLGTVNASRD